MTAPTSEDLPERDVESAAAYAAGGLGGEEKLLFEERMAADPRLREEVEAFREVIAHLRSAGPQPLSKDMTSEVLERLRDRQRRVRLRLAVGACAASLIVLGVGAFITFGQRDGAVAPGRSLVSGAAESSLWWLSQNQEPDGSWDPRKWGGQESLRVSLTALGALAFLRWADECKKPQYVETVGRALAFLLKCQNEKGRIAGGVSGGNLCQHAVATLALAEAYLQGRRWVRGGLEQALTYLEKTQLPSGGWSAEGDSAPSLEVTVWQLAALSWGRRAGLPVKREVLARGGMYVAACISGGAGARLERFGVARSASALGSLCLLVLEKDLPKLSAVVQKTTYRIVRFPWQCVLFAAVALPEGPGQGGESGESRAGAERFPALAGPLSQRIISALVGESGRKKTA